MTKYNSPFSQRQSLFWAEADRRTNTRFRASGKVATGASGLLPEELGGQDKTSLSIGMSRLVHSGILKEGRILSVRLPEDYEKSRLSYPVVYLLCGGQTAGYFAETVFNLERLAGGAEIPDFLLVGIHNTDRYGTSFR